jgi:hypothetical protein
MRGERTVPALAVLGSAALILGPLLRPGYVLSYDMVFAPDMPVDANSFGLGSQLPRAVPSDLVVAAASHVLQGDLVQKLVLAGLLVAAGFGAARVASCVAAPTAATRTAAALAYLWTPYLGERLLLGQWAVLVGYAGLPWVVVAAHRVRRAERDEVRTAWAGFVLVLGLMCLGGAPAWLLAVLTVPFALGWGIRDEPRAAVLRLLGGFVALACYALPWLVPALTRPGGIGADPLGAEAFAPRADTPFGAVGSVVTGGGIWNAQTVPPGRGAVLPAIAAAALVVIGVVGVVRRRRDPLVAALAVAAVVGLAVAMFTCWAPGARFIGGLPGGALLRDSQRLVAPWLLLIAVGFAVVCGDLLRRSSRTAAPAVALLVLLPVAVLPALSWGVFGRLTAVDYPADFGQVRARVAADDRPGAVVVLPFDAYRRFGWNHDRTVLDPVDRWLDRTVIVSSDLPVLRPGGRVLLVRGEDRLAARVAAQLDGGSGSFARQFGGDGVRWVVVESGAGAGFDRAVLAGLVRHYRGPDLSLYEVPARWVRQADNPLRGFAPPAAAVVCADAVAAGLLLAGAVTTGLWAGVALRERR